MTGRGVNAKIQLNACRYGGQLCGVGQIIAAPDHVQIGPQQQKVVAIDLTRACASDIEDGDGRAIARKSPCQQCAIGRGACRRRSVNPSPIRSCSAVPSVSQTCGSRAPGHDVGTYFMKSSGGPSPASGQMTADSR